MNEHSTSVENIWLMHERKNGFEYAVVYVQREGKWYEAIRELLDGPFSHCISSYGLVDDRCCTPATWLNEIKQGMEASEHA